MLTPSDWDQRYQQQARWTEELRRHVYRQIKLNRGKVLEIGCGTGALFRDFNGYTKIDLFGLDLDLDALAIANRNYPGSLLSCGNGYALPFPDSMFEVVICHFLLLWIKQPLQLLAQMVRVTQSGGHILALAEPDYGGRIDFPPELERFGKLQTESLKHQGADPFIGRKLIHLFHHAGVQNIHAGILGASWEPQTASYRSDMEFRVIQSDLAHQVTEAQLDQIQEIYEHSEDRVVHVPTFYAWGKKT